MPETDDDHDLAEVPIQGVMASAEDEFFVEFGEEIFKKTIPFLNDVLRQLLTTSIALSGGTLMFLTDPRCDKNLKLAAAVMFFLAIGCSFVGVLPYRDSFRPDCPAEIKANANRVTWWKYGWVSGAVVFIALGLVLAFVGVWFGMPPA